MSQNVQPRRIVLSLLVLGIGLIHLLDLPGKWAETRWMGVGYVGLIATSVLAADVLLWARGRLTLLLAAGLAAGPMLGFILTRTTGLPGAVDDIGNWGEPLGLASLFVEGVTLVIAAAALVADSVTMPGEASATLGARAGLGVGAHAASGAVPAPRLSGQRAHSRAFTPSQN